MRGVYRESTGATDAQVLARERSRYASFWQRASVVDRRIRVAGTIAIAAFFSRFALVRLFVPAAWMAVGVMTIAAGVAYISQLRLRQMRCPRCNDRYFGAHARLAMATMCSRCQLARDELRTEVLLGPGNPARNAGSPPCHCDVWRLAENVTPTSRAVGNARTR